MKLSLRRKPSDDAMRGVRSSSSAPQAGDKPEQKGDRNDAKRFSQHQQHQQQARPASTNNAMAAAFAKLKA